MSVPDDCPLVGTWSLVGYEIRSRQGRHAGRPQWKHSRGQLLYTPDGEMSVQISNGRQVSFDAVHRWDGAPADKARAFDDYLGYGGTYRWLSDRVIHVIEVSLYPNWIGTEQVRYVDIQDNDRLILTDVKDHSAAGLILTWQRVQTS